MPTFLAFSKSGALITVRVAQALEVVGQAASRERTHQPPAWLATTERAELETEEFVPFSVVLIGFEFEFEFDCLG
ncbi:hypothetical protein B0H12DRAFT_1242062 [Mycena haematopus]|nr:hypothetical protein B0H12DRAFT_1242062 [Mycena haematopus]